MRSLLMTVGDVFMGLTLKLSPLGTKDASIVHSFVCWNVCISSQSMYKQAPPAFKHGYRDQFFIA